MPPLVEWKPRQVHGQPGVVLTPGESGILRVDIRNTSDIVEEFDVTVLGAAAAWAEVSPNVPVSLFPGDDAEVVITLRPRRVWQRKPGIVHVGVMVASAVDEANVTIKETDVFVGEFTEVQAWLRPSSRGFRFHGAYRVIVANTGNADLPVRLTAFDAAEQLTFEFDRNEITIPPGTTLDMPVRVRVRPVLRGAVQPFPFSVLVLDNHPRSPDDPELVDPILLFQVDGTATRRPVIGPWIIRALAVLAVLALIAGFVVSRSAETDPNAPVLVGPPPVPSDFTATADTSGTAVRLTWTDAGGQDTVQVYQLTTPLPPELASQRSPTCAPLQAAVASPAAATTTVAKSVPNGCTAIGQVPAGTSAFLVTNLAPAPVPQCFRLVALRGKVASEFTKSTCALLTAPSGPALPCPPVAPFAVPLAVAPAVSIAALQVSWQAATTSPACAAGGSPVVEIQAQKAGGRELVASSKPGDTAVTVQGLAPKTVYQLYARSVLPTGASDWVTLAPVTTSGTTPLPNVPGPAGPAGPGGPAGPPGPATLAALEGSPCTVPPSPPGKVHVSIAPVTHLVSLACTVPPALVVSAPSPGVGTPNVGAPGVAPCPSRQLLTGAWAQLKQPANPLQPPTQMSMITAICSNLVATASAAGTFTVAVAPTGTDGGTLGQDPGAGTPRVSCPTGSVVVALATNQFPTPAYLNGLYLECAPLNPDGSLGPPYWNATAVVPVGTPNITGTFDPCPSGAIGAGFAGASTPAGPTAPGQLDFFQLQCVMLR